MQKSVRYHIIVKGYVQGVGYRYFCYKKAKVFGLNGYVKNLYNGDVELEFEGEEGILNDYIKELRIGPEFSSVKSLNTQKLQYTGDFKEFLID
jgi:acylphosphatase